MAVIRFSCSGKIILAATIAAVLLFAMAAPAQAQHRASVAVGLPAFTQYSQSEDASLTYAFSGIGVRLGTEPAQGLSLAWRSSAALLTALDVTVEDSETELTEVVEFRNAEKTFLWANMIGIDLRLNAGALGIGISCGLGFNFYYDQANREVYLGLGLAGGIQAAVNLGDFGIVLGLDAGTDIISRYAADPLGEFDIGDSVYLFPYVGLEF